MFHEVRRAAQLTIKKVTRTRNLVKAVRVCKRYRKYTGHLEKIALSIAVCESFA
jgi:hypothetical protein